MVGGLSGSKSRGRGPPGQLPKANSLGDFNEAEEEGRNIGQMSDQVASPHLTSYLISQHFTFQDILEEFEKMLENMNLTEEKKEPLRMLPINKKRDMLTMNSKSMARTKFDSPADYIQFLSNPELSLSKKLHCIESLRVALTNNSLEWVQDFGNKGLKQVLNVLNECFRK